MAPQSTTEKIPMNLNQAEKNEITLKALLETSEGDFRSLACAFHNIFSHGEIFEEYGYDFEDEDLGKLFDHLDGVIAATKKITS